MQCKLVSVKSNKLKQSGEQGWGVAHTGHAGDTQIVLEGPSRCCTPARVRCWDLRDPPGAGDKGSGKGLAAGQLGDIKLRGYYLKRGV